MVNHRHRFQLLYFLFQDSQPPLHTVGTVRREFKTEGEELELVVQPSHVWVVPFLLVKNKVTLAVERFQIRFDTCRFVGLPVLVRMNVELYVPFISYLCYQRFEHLLKKRILQFIVLHIAVHRNFTAHIFK